MISGGEIFLIFLAILLTFGAKKIPEFARVMGKGVREFKKAADDIKREINDGTSGVMSEIRSIGEETAETFHHDIAEPMQQTLSESAESLKEDAESMQAAINDPGVTDYYYNNKDFAADGSGEFAAELKAKPENTTTQP